MDRNMVTVVNYDGKKAVASSMPESEYDPAKHMLAKGSAIPARAAIAVGATASATLHSLAGNPDDADLPGLIPVAFNPPAGNMPAGLTAAPGSKEAQARAESNDIPSAVTGDAAKANPDAPKSKSAEPVYDTGQIFTAKVKGGKFAVCSINGELFSDQTYDTREAAVAAYQQPTKARH